MKKIITLVSTITIVSATVWILMAMYFPLTTLPHSKKLGTAFTTISSSDRLSDFVTTHNGNIALTPNLTTSNAFQDLNTFPYASSTIFSCSVCYFGGSATTTSTNGVRSLVSPLSIANGGIGQGYLGGTNTVLYTSAANTIATSSLFTFNGSTNTLSVTNISMSTTSGATTTLSGALSIASSSASYVRKLWINGAAGTEECTLTDGATVTFDLSQCNQARVVLGGNRALDITNETQAMGQPVRLTVCSDGSARSISSFDSAILWSAGTAPTQTAAANKCDVYAGFVTKATGTPVILLGFTGNF